MILNLLSFPRSGNSFFTSMLAGLETTWLHGGSPIEVLACGLTPPLEGIYPQSPRRSNDISRAELEDPHKLYVCKSHNANIVFPGSKNIVIIRNGVDAIFSWVDYHLKMNRIEVTQKTRREEAIRKIEHEPWSMRTREYLNHPGTVAVVRYEQLNLEVAQAALLKAGFQTKPSSRGVFSFENLNRADSTHFAYGHQRSSLHLFPDLEAWFKARHHEVLSELGYL